jgi:hypothetical protein
VRVRGILVDLNYGLAQHRHQVFGKICRPKFSQATTAGAEGHSSAPTFSTMNYHLSRDGQNLGVFPLDELRRSRAAGRFDGSEFVWCAGMTEWQPIDSVLTAKPAPSAPPVISATATANSNRSLFIALGTVLAMLAIGAVVVFGLVRRGLRSADRFATTSARAEAAARADGDEEPFAESTAMAAASAPVEVGTNSQTAADRLKRGHEFRERQYIDGYKLRGERNDKVDARSLELLQGWVAANFGGEANSDAPALQSLANQLAGDANCTDPVVLTAAAVNSAEVHEAVRRLERAANGFENSQHRAYPKFFTTVLLGNKIFADRTDRLPVLDATALQYLKTALTDGSVQPSDQAEVGEILIGGWANNFFTRNAGEVVNAVEAQGKSFRWLALTLRGEMEIDRAWAARGDGYADSVGEKNWEGFRSHLVLARKALTQAWRLEPKLPLAPCRMMSVALGQSSIGEMRRWFDRTVAAQIDYPGAWNAMRWGLRSRWYGDRDAMLAFGVTALNTHRYDTDVPRVFFDSALDIESESKLNPGQRIFEFHRVWPHVQEMYEGYIAATTNDCQRGWRSTYAVVASLSQSYDIAAQQFAAMNWQPVTENFKDWRVDLSLLPPEIKARTGPHAVLVAKAEARRKLNLTADALAIYRTLAATNLDELTRTFVLDRLTTLELEAKLHAGEWVNFLPTTTNLVGWQIERGKFQLQPDGSLQVAADENGHLIYSRAHPGTELEVRGKFDVVSSSTKSFQAGIVMGLPQFDSMNWYAFRMKRTPDEGDIATFSQHWIKRQIQTPFNFDSSTNIAFHFRLQSGLVTASINERTVFTQVPPPQNSYVSTNEFLLGLGAFNSVNQTTIRYRELQVRQLPATSRTGKRSSVQPANSD